MKLVCGRCGQEIVVPDEWAGKAVRCRGCNKVLRVPAISAAEPDDIDLEALGSPDPAAEPDELATEWPDFQAIQADDEAEQSEDGTRRTCPFCGKQLKVESPDIEVLCSNCWRSVPPVGKPVEEGKAHDALLPGAKGLGSESALGFYTGAVRAVVYPFAAAGSIVVAMIVAIGLILLPVGLMLLIVAVMKEEPVHGARYRVDWLTPVLCGMFLLELLYFIGVAYYAFIDTVRNTLIGTERPPNVTWNITTVSQAFLGYLGLILYYAVPIFLILLIHGKGRPFIPTSIEQLRPMLSTVNLLVLALLTLMVPMSLIGMASGKLLEGMNPVKVLTSIARTAGHYMFLFCLDCLYMALYVTAMVTLLDWTGQMIVDVVRKGGEQSIASLALGLGLWGLLIGIGLYFAYVVGRLHGLFARAFHRQLAFDM
jgi:hypothetical protein